MRYPLLAAVAASVALCVPNTLADESKPNGVPQGFDPARVRAAEAIADVNRRLEQRMLEAHGVQVVQGGIRVTPPAVRFGNVADEGPRPFLGVAATPADGVPGLLISGVTPESPAAESGLEAGDVLLRLDDQLLINTEQLIALVRLKGVGTEVALTVTRDGKERELAATLIERPADRDMIRKDALHPAFRMQQRRLFENDLRLNPPRLQPFGFGGAEVRQQLTYQDADGTITFDTDRRQTLVQLHDADGNLLYEGVPDPRDDVAALLDEGVIARLAEARRLFNYGQ